jgi:fucose permease
MMISALLMIFFFFNTKLDTADQENADKNHEHFRVSPFLLSLAGMIAVYVGSETAMGGWTTTYLHSTTSLAIEGAALATSGFWLALTLGRVMGAVLGSRITAANLLKLCFGITMAGSIVYAASFGNEVWSIIAILIIGFGFGAIFPTIFSILTSSYKGASGKAATLLTATGSASGMLLPWLQGVIFDNFGMHWVSYMTVGLAALLWAAFAINRQVAKKSLQLVQ